jgi:dCTP deaminase
MLRFALVPMLLGLAACGTLGKLDASAERRREIADFSRVVVGEFVANDTREAKDEDEARRRAEEIDAGRQAFSEKIGDEHQGRPLDTPHGGRSIATADDRTVRTRPGAAGATGGASLSYGTSSYGYDVRCAATNSRCSPTSTRPSSTRRPSIRIPSSTWSRTSCIIPPNSFALARTVEYFRIPRNVLVVCLGKSTYARCGIIVNVTPLEPEWEGHVTLEFSNTTPLPAKIYAHEGVAQMLFFESDEPCETSYRDRGGKYQGQMGVTLPRT